MPPAFECPVSTTAGRVAICVAGEVDLATAPVLLTTMLASIDARPVDLTVDLDAVTFLDSSGIQALLAARKHAGAVGVRFVLAAVPERVQLVLRLTGVDDLFLTSAASEAACHTSA